MYGNRIGANMLVAVILLALTVGLSKPRRTLQAHSLLMSQLVLTCLASGPLRSAHIGLWATQLPSLASWRPLQLQQALTLSALPASWLRTVTATASAAVAPAGGEGSPPAVQQQLLQPGLYLVSTPLGNLSDFSHRAADVLRRSDLVLAENPRHSAVLLQAHGISGG